MAVAVTAAVFGTTVVVARHGGPAEFLNQRLGEFKQSTSPSFSSQGTRFGLDVSSKRGDLWRVSLNEFEDHPLAGGGAGSFEFSYLRDRRTGLTPKDPHSVEMLMLAGRTGGRGDGGTGGTGGTDDDVRAECAGRLEDAIASGNAARKFQEIIEAQGGNPAVVDDPALLPQAECVEVYYARSAGTILVVEPRAIGRAVVQMGGGRQQVDDVVAFLDALNGDKVLVAAPALPE